jgi:hypothetical protein
VVRLEVQPYLARHVARKTRDLTPEQAAYVDDRMAEYADGRLTWTRFQTRLEAVVKAADPDTAAAQERAAAEQQIAKATRSDEHGMRGFYIRAPFATIAVFEAALERIAQILADLGDTECRDRRRVKALLILSRPDLAAELVTAYRAWRDRPADPPELPADETHAADNRSEEMPRTGDKPEIDWASLLPQFVVYAHLYAGADTDGIAPDRGLRLRDRELGPRPPRRECSLHDSTRPRHPGAWPRWTPTRYPTDIDRPSRS